MRIALITGASSGLGAGFAREVVQKENNIDEIWLIARRRERLEEVASSLNIKTRIVVMDVTSEDAVNEFEKTLAETKNADSSFEIGLFINCAGYGKIGNYEKVSRYDSAHMIDLNCKAAVIMTLLCIPYMSAGDRIVEICSTSAFQPLQHLNLYAASKVFLYNYTRALRMELLPKGIVVTAVCPWWVGDTEFIGVAKNNDANANVKAGVAGFPLATKQKNVERRALNASRAGFAVSTPGFMCFIHRMIAKIVPRTAMMYIWELFRKVG